MTEIETNDATEAWELCKEWPPSSWHEILKKSKNFVDFTRQYNNHVNNFYTYTFEDQSSVNVLHVDGKEPKFYNISKPPKEKSN